jgi:site-specific DNA recombinase
MAEQRGALIYCRVSRSQQETEGTSLESQESECRNFAETRGYRVVRVTKEVYTGIELWDRPQLARDRADIRAKKFNALICLATDRLSRDPIHLAIIAEECARAGVELLFVTEPMDMSPEGALIRYVRGYAAKIEHEKIRERSMRGKREKYLAGKYVQGGPNLYGYEHDKESGLRKIIDSEVRIVRQIYEWVAEGVGSREISRRLNNSSVPSPSKNKIKYITDKVGHRWNPTTIRRLVTEPAYKGETYVCRYRSGRPASKVVLRDRSEWIRLPDNVTPAIISNELWEQANGRLKANKGELSRNVKHPALLRGFMFCAVCGRRLYVDSKHPVYGYYRCSSRTYTNACGSRMTRSSRCEEWVWNLITSILENPDVIRKGRQALEEAAASFHLKSDIEAMMREMDKLQRAEQRLLHRLREADDEVANLIELELKQVAQEKRQVAASIETLNSRVNREEASRIQLKSVYELSAQVRDRLKTFTFEEKVKTLDALRVKVYANGDNYRLDVPLLSGEVIQGH